jgi:hypothetical protein
MGVFKPTVVAASLLISSVALAGGVKITALYSQPKSTEEFDNTIAAHTCRWCMPSRK